MTDPQWMQDALSRWRQNRESEALGELLKAQRDRAYSLAVRLTDSAEGAEDVVQEAFVKLMSREKGFESLGEFQTAVNRAVFQCAVDELRSGRRRERRERRAGLEAAVAAGPGERTEAVMFEREKGELRAQLRAAVQALPEATRFPAVLCYYQGLSEAEAAEALDVPRTTLRRRLASAVDDLRRRLDRDGRRTSGALLVGLMAGEGLLAAPPTLCAALDAALPGRSCAQIPALGGAEGLPAVPAAFGAGKVTAVAVAAVAAVLALVLALAVPGSLAQRQQRSGASPEGLPAAQRREREQLQTESHRSAANVAWLGDGSGTVAVPRDPKEEEEMRGKLSGMAAVIGGAVLFGAAGAAEPSAEVGAVIGKIQARQTAKAEAAAKDAEEQAKLHKQYGGQGQAGGGRHGQ